MSERTLNIFIAVAMIGLVLMTMATFYEVSKIYDYLQPNIQHMNVETRKL